MLGFRGKVFNQVSSRSLNLTVNTTLVKETINDNLSSNQFISKTTMMLTQINLLTPTSTEMNKKTILKFNSSKNQISFLMRIIKGQAKKDIIPMLILVLKTNKSPGNNNSQLLMQLVGEIRFLVMMETMKVTSKVALQNSNRL